MSDVFRAGHLPGVPAESIVWRDLGLTDPAWRGGRNDEGREAEAESRRDGKGV